jgi:alpha-tubulin suppressor-like RCC1 family protein
VRKVSSLITSANKIGVRMFTSATLSLVRTLKCFGFRSWLAALALFSLNPAQALPSGAYTDVATGANHACGVLATGLVQCWGENVYGQLGNNANVASSTAVDVIGVASALAVAAGYSHSCALIAGGSVKCWGSNDVGQLGDPTVSASPIAVSVTGMSNAIAISANRSTTCALQSSGTVACWGTVPGLGNAASAVEIAGMSGSTALSVGSDHICAVRSGQVWCQGANGSGQLGNNSTAPVTVPVQALGIATGATAVSAGDTHTCAVVSGAVYCWGNNAVGQIGDGALIGLRLSPTLVPGLSGVVAIEAKYSNSCAVLSGGALRCWGENSTGRLGNNTGIGSATPVAVHGISDAIRVSLGERFTCVLRTSGSVECWGANASGQLGNAAAFQSNVPVQVGNLTGATWVAAGFLGACAVSGGGALGCWGENRGDGGSAVNTGFPATVAGITTATSVSLGIGSSCVRLSSAALMCWGDNNFGELGTGNTTPSNVPVASVTGVSQVSGGGSFFCAIMSNFTNLSVKCWGQGVDGRLGNGADASSSVPVFTGIGGSTVIAGSPYPISVAAGFGHACAVVSTGAVKCWGFGGSGQIGTGTASSNVPITVAMPSGLAASQITAGYDHSCARLTDGRVACWGRNGSGQLGNGLLPSAAQSTPSFVVGISNAISVSAAARSYHTCALLNDGKVKCWGYNRTGQLGNGSTVSSSEPVFVAGISNATQIAVGAEFSCALLADTTVKCWGINQSGYLGDGNGPVSQLLPTPVQPSQCSMDIDGDGVVNPLTDGLLMTRAAAGMSGTTVTNNAIGAQATRRDWRGIRAYLNGPCGMSGLAP